jgi:hypothetical protein
MRLFNCSKTTSLLSVKNKSNFQTKVDTKLIINLLSVIVFSFLFLNPSSVWAMGFAKKTAVRSQGKPFLKPSIEKNTSKQQWTGSFLSVNRLFSKKIKKPKPRFWLWLFPFLESSTSVCGLCAPVEWWKVSLKLFEWTKPPKPHRIGLISLIKTVAWSIYFIPLTIAALVVFLLALLGLGLMASLFGFAFLLIYWLLASAFAWSLYSLGAMVIAFLLGALSYAILCTACSS